MPDVAEELSNGCYGFAAAYMHWPEQLIVGGATRNVTSALRSARALQTVVQLMGEREMFDYWAESYKVHHVGWSQQKAAAVLDAWQRKFASVSIFIGGFNLVVNDPIQSRMEKLPVRVDAFL